MSLLAIASVIDRSRMKTLLGWSVISLLTLASLYVISNIVIFSRARAVVGPTRSGISPSEWAAPYIALAGDAALIGLTGLVCASICWMIAKRIFPDSAQGPIIDFAMKTSLITVPPLVSAIYVVYVAKWVWLG